MASPLDILDAPPTDPFADTIVIPVADIERRRLTPERRAAPVGIAPVREPSLRSRPLRLTAMIVGGLAGAAAVTALVLWLVHLVTSPAAQHLPIAVRASTPATSRPPAATTPANSPTAAPPANNAQHAALQWVVAQLPSSSPVFSDAATAGLLGQAGRAAVQSRPQSWRSADWVLATPQLRRLAGSVKRVHKALASAVPVAIFGSGPTRVEIGRLLPGGRRAAVRAMAADADVRRTAELQLLRNRRVHIDAAARRAFATGAVDLRAATLLAVVSRSSDVTVTAVSIDPAEHAAELPARRLVLAFANDLALPDALAVLPPPYRPSLIQGSNQRCRVTWAVQIPPLPSVH